MRTCSSPRALLLAIVFLLACTGCRKTAAARIQNISDALIDRQDPAALWADLPKCPNPVDGACVQALARALGSKNGFNLEAPNQATSATAAILLLRDHSGSGAVSLDTWLLVLREGKGPGADLLRLAVSARLTAVGSQVARRWSENASLKQLLFAIATAVPGACPTYGLLGAGAADESLPAELGANVSACIHHDLQRRDGPGTRYAGQPLTRVSYAATAAYTDTVRALRSGIRIATPTVQHALETAMTEIERASNALQLDLPKSEDDGTHAYLGQAHANAGILLWQDADAGAGPLAMPKSSSGAHAGATPPK
jgi:hypothetical protein